MSPDPIHVKVVQKPQRLKAFGAAGAALMFCAVALGLGLRFHEHQQLVQWTDAQLIPTVRIAPVADPAKVHRMTLPGHLEAWYRAPIHARVGGYLKAWYKDIGDKVKAGDILAVIDTPELDQQLEQAKAVLAKARADANLANITAGRWRHLLDSDSVSKQEADEKAGEAAATQATVLAANADVERLQALESFKKIVAPFDGVVTARRTDVGDLMIANNERGAQLFTVSDISRVRLYVSVPEVEANAIKPGMTVTLSVPELPGRSFEATLIGNSNAISRTSGSLLAQFVADNSDGALKPGDYANVAFALPVNPRIVSIPSSALIFRDKGAQVAVFGPDSRAHLRKVHIALDMGATLEIDQGLSMDDQVIENPPDSLMNGDKVSAATSWHEATNDAGS